MNVKPPPPELIASRPVLADEGNFPHPATEPNLLGSPPAKYTRAVHERIIEELKRGQRPQGATARAGITMSTFYNWMSRGKSGDPWLVEFFEDVELAYNSAEATLVDTVMTGALVDDVEAAKWGLERMRPDGFSKQVRTAVETQIKDFMLRLEAALEPHIFEKVLEVYLGQAPSVTPQLPEHAANQTVGESE